MTTTPSDPSSPRTSSGPEGPGFFERAWRWIKRTVLWLVLGVILLAVAWTLVALNFAYSSGERAGVVQKFSKRGWLCKTWEGELALINYPGAMPEIWRFTVRDDAVAAEINRLLGQRVRLHYDQHKFIPTDCFGETEYFVNRAETLSDQRPPGF